MSNKTKKLLILNLPYFIAGLVCTNLGEAWRIAEGADMSEKLLELPQFIRTAQKSPYVGNIKFKAEWRSVSGATPVLFWMRSWL